MDTTGLIVVAVVLLLGTAAGLWRRRTDGRLRPVTGGAGTMTIGVPGAGEAVAPGRGGSRAAAAPRGPGMLAAAGAAASTADAAADGVSAADAVDDPSTADIAGGVSTADAVGGPSTADAVGGPSAADAVGGPGAADAGGDPSAAGVRLDPVLLRELGVLPAAATLLQFSSAFCAPCRALRRVSTEVVTLLPDVQHVEVDAESHLDAVRALGIWRTPTLLVLDAGGRVVKRATGVPGKPQLIAVLGELMPAA
jgi:thiol-disulfide isomerase/thioredoxin